MTSQLKTSLRQRQILASFPKNWELLSYPALTLPNQKAQKYLLSKRMRKVMHPTSPSTSGLPPPKPESPTEVKSPGTPVIVEAVDIEMTEENKNGSDHESSE